ncbi:MAG: phosphotransferase family protein [Bavariicoccus seileri]|uniref:phosphotransferase family protein n=1 Tax=Bavariicoccus seileri TaxID=549685 RepID=UPI0003B43CD4|nr:phosphotransferase family protein [Bavariicoccus seileri]
MDYNSDSGWQLHPIGGDTGQAYMGTKEDQRIFLKKNSSPFLAALSTEGITAKLIWTKRSHNGDILTAQEWLDGRTLAPDEMASDDVITILRHVHGSQRLLNMLEQVQGKVYEPADFISDYQDGLHHDLVTHSWLNKVLAYLQDTADTIPCYHKTVCHGDLNRKNFIQSEEEQLFLVDWESVKISDPVFDLTYLLTHYVPLASWDEWFERYGLSITTKVYHRIEWYSLMSLLLLIKQEHFEGRNRQVNEKIILLRQIYQQRSLKS